MLHLWVTTADPDDSIHSKFELAASRCLSPGDGLPFLFSRPCLQSSAPCILFIDEIDAITPKREVASKDMERRIVAQMLTCMDGTHSFGHTSCLSQLFLVVSSTRSCWLPGDRLSLAFHTDSFCCCLFCTLSNLCCGVFIYVHNDVISL